MEDKTNVFPIKLIQTYTKSDKLLIYNQKNRMNILSKQNRFGLSQINISDHYEHDYLKDQFYDLR